MKVRELADILLDLISQGKDDYELEIVDSRDLGRKITFNGYLETKDISWCRTEQIIPVIKLLSDNFPQYSEKKYNITIEKGSKWVSGRWLFEHSHQEEYYIVKINYDKIWRFDNWEEANMLKEFLEDAL